VLEGHRPAVDSQGALVAYSSLQITRQVVAYKEQHYSGREISKDLTRPWSPVDFNTDGLVLELPGSWLDALADPGGAVRALEHVLLSVAPAVLACDPYDLDTSSDRHRIYLYDSFGAGLRISEVLYERFGDLVELAHEVVATCPCADGCPSCVMLARRPDGNSDLSKSGALDLIDRLGTSSVPFADSRS
jgi:DEAD/DEAH box helicase domain-containing protein